MDAHEQPEGSQHLIVMAGLPGTGKSTLAQALAARLPALVLDKDIIRARLFAPGRIEYSREQDDLCMEVIYLITEHVLRADRAQRIIIDGRTFSRGDQVKDLLFRTERLRLTPVFIECVCTDAVAKERLERDRAAGTHPAGNRNFELYLELKEKAEPLSPDHLVIDTGKEPLKRSVEGCLAYLDNTR